jgi:hypothetical protein
MCSFGIWEWRTRNIYRPDRVDGLDYRIVLVRYILDASAKT